MRISFDLDDTLILKTVEASAEPTLPPLKRSYIDEWLREGTKDLIQALVSRGHEIWIYTNSYRSKTELLGWFSKCGLPLSGVVNQQMHDMKRAELGLLALRPSKSPRWFGIDMHIDDSLELAMDAVQHGFRVVRITPDDREWARTIITAVDRAMKESAEHEGHAVLQRGVAAPLGVS